MLLDLWYLEQIMLINVEDIHNQNLTTILKLIYYLANVSSVLPMKFDLHALLIQLLQ